jgi:hypothetical protein
MRLVGRKERKGAKVVDLAQRSRLLEEKNAKARRCKDAKVVDLAQRSRLLEERNAKARRRKDAKVEDLAQGSKECLALRLAR